MNEYDIACRLKHMFSEDRKISQYETKIARKSAKYYQQITDVKTSLNKQELELSACRAKVNELKRCYTKLQLIIQKKEESLCVIMQKVEQMEADYHQQLKNQFEERKTMLMRSDCIRNLKQSTQTYINLSALPHTIQGVTLCEKETSTDWKPFCIDRLKHTGKQIQDIIWHDTQLDSVHRETWDKLVLGDLLEEHNVDMQTESGDDRVI